MAIVLRKKGTGELFAFTPALAVRDDMEPVEFGAEPKSAPSAPPEQKPTPAPEPEWTKITNKRDLADYALAQHKILLDTKSTITEMRAKLMEALGALPPGDSEPEQTDPAKEGEGQ